MVLQTQWQHRLENKSQTDDVMQTQIWKKSFTWRHLFQPSLLGSGNLRCWITWPQFTLHLGENRHLRYYHFKLAWPVRGHAAGLRWRGGWVLNLGWEKCNSRQMFPGENMKGIISSPPLVLPVNFILFCVIYQCRSSKTVCMTREMNASSTAAQLCRSGHDYERWCKLRFRNHDTIT